MQPFPNTTLSNQGTYPSNRGQEYCANVVQNTQSSLSLLTGGSYKYEPSNSSDAFYQIPTGGPNTQMMVEMQNNFNLQNANHLDIHHRSNYNFGNRSCRYGNTPCHQYFIETTNTAPNYQIINCSQLNSCADLTPNTFTKATKRPKRDRTAFTTEQIMQLDLAYKRFKYLDKNQRIQLSNFMKLPENTIKVWFQNKRMKVKKEMAEQIEESKFVSTTGISLEINKPQYSYPQTKATGIINQYRCDQFVPQMCYKNYQPFSMPTIDLSNITVPVENVINNPVHHLRSNSNGSSCSSMETFENITFDEVYSDFTAMLLDHNEKLEDFQDTSALQTSSTNTDGTNEENVDSYSLIRLLDEL